LGKKFQKKHFMGVEEGCLGYWGRDKYFIIYVVFSKITKISS
jgi:hypothetical protein